MKLRDDISELHVLFETRGGAGRIERIDLRRARRGREAHDGDAGTSGADRLCRLDAVQARQAVVDQHHIWPPLVTEADRVHAARDRAHDLDVGPQNE